MDEHEEQPQGPPIQVSELPFNWALQPLRAPGGNRILLQVASPLGVFGFFFDVQKAEEIGRAFIQEAGKLRLEVAPADALDHLPKFPEQNGQN